MVRSILEPFNCSDCDCRTALDPSFRSSHWPFICPKHSGKQSMLPAPSPMGSAWPLPLGLHVASAQASHCVRFPPNSSAEILSCNVLR